MEKRFASRINLTLRVEIWPAFDRKPLDPVVFTTRNISTIGFYFESESSARLASKFSFSIIFPEELTGDGYEYIRGIGTIVRVKKIGEDRHGVGVHIERLGF
jgi:hypothetical protein